MTTTPLKPKPPFPKQRLGDKPGLEASMGPKPQFEGKNYHPADKLKGKRALITGGDSGIGRSVAYLFAREGAEVGIIFTEKEWPDANELIEAAKKHGHEILPIVCDVTDFGSCKKAVEKFVHHFGGLDILVNNAAFQNHVYEIEDLTLEQWDTTFKTNIYGYFHMVKATLPHLPKGSVILNTGSITGLEGAEGLLDYASTKGAIHAFTKTLAKMLVGKGVRVNCVAPGPVWTPLNPVERSDKETAHFGEKTPMGRPAQPDEIAPAYVFFASQADSSYITGEVLTLLGGETTAA
jgi:NAD(P)-dependent dehydrogenase (short-subunit alcohol dehydrogenase family)